MITSVAVEVHVVTTTVYRFPEPTDRCSAHGQSLCIMCARNPSTCATSDSPPCGTYSATGMHWDTCPNRDRSALVTNVEEKEDQ